MELFAMLSTYSEKELVDALMEPRLAPGNPDLDSLNSENFFKLGRVPLLNVNLVRALIDNGHLDVDAKMHTTGHRHPYLEKWDLGCTILHYAVMWANFELIDMLVEKNADVNLANHFTHQNIPLNSVFEYDNNDWDGSMRIRLLRALNAKGKLDIRATGNHTPLWDGMMLGYDVLNELILMGANVNEKMRRSFGLNRPDVTCWCAHLTVFTYAVVTGHLEVAWELKLRGADTEKHGSFQFGRGSQMRRLRALEYACLYGTIDELGQLLNIGVNVNAVDEEGRTALWKVAHKFDDDRHERIQMLINHNADVSIRCSSRIGGTTAFEIALNDAEELLMEQALARRRVLHAWALLRTPHNFPKELVEGMLLENGL
jgi:ankyrin repeat protein